MVNAERRTLNEENQGLNVLAAGPSILHSAFLALCYTLRHAFRPESNDKFLAKVSLKSRNCILNLALSVFAFLLHISEAWVQSAFCILGH
jgi:hypothetical protein